MSQRCGGPGQNLTKSVNVFKFQLFQGTSHRFQEKHQLWNAALQLLFYYLLQFYTKILWTVVCLNPDSACFHRCFQTFWLRTVLDWHLPCCALRFIAPVHTIRQRIKHRNFVNVANGIHNYRMICMLIVFNFKCQLCWRSVTKDKTNSRTWSAEKSARGLRPARLFFECVIDIQMLNDHSKHHPRRIRTASIATGRAETWLTLTCCRSVQIMKNTRVGVHRCSTLELPALSILRSKICIKKMKLCLDG